MAFGERNAVERSAAEEHRKSIQSGNLAKLDDVRLKLAQSRAQPDEPNVSAQCIRWQTMKRASIKAAYADRTPRLAQEACIVNRVVRGIPIDLEVRSHDVH